MPIILICGQAGSGKDTVAGLIKKHTRNTITIAQADPMKRLAGDVFDFTDEQMWGPSECRNAVDPRYNEKDPKPWEDARERLHNLECDWIRDVLYHLNDHEVAKAVLKLRRWFFSLSSGHGLTPRTVLQTLGTEVGRAIDPDMWSRYAISCARKLLEGGFCYSPAQGLAPDVGQGIPDFVLITDGRFPNEIMNVHAVGGRSLLVWNQDIEAGAAVEAAGVAGHASEAYLKQIPRHWFTDALLNDKRHGLAALEEVVAGYVRVLKRRTINFSV